MQALELARRNIARASSAVTAALLSSPLNVEIVILFRFCARLAREIFLAFITGLV